jgi:hypothetical protein
LPFITNLFTASDKNNALRMKKNFTLYLKSFPVQCIKRYCKGIALFFICIAAFANHALAQPTVLGTDIVSGPPAYITYALNPIGAFKQYKIQASNNAIAGTIQWQFTQGTTGAPDYTNTWRPYSGSCNGNTDVQIVGYNTFIAPNAAFPSTTATATYSGNTACPGFLPAVTAGNYYTFNVTNSGPVTNNNMSVLETVYNPATITSVTQSPATVGGTVSPTVTVVMSAAPSVGENVFVRYSTDNFVTSTLVQLSFVAATGTASIPAQAAGLTVRYYVYSSPKTSAQIGTDVTTYGQTAHDMATLNLNNNAGANYSYLVLPVTVNATNVANDASYNTLAAAFAAINSGTHTGAINVWISGNTTETISAVLNASGAPSSYTSVTVRPSGFRTVTGSIAGPLVDLNGADNVTIDGLNDGSNTLTFTNTSTGGAGTSTVRMYSNALTNNLQNCTIEGSSTSITDGVITLGSGTNTTISITGNTIRSTGGNLPVYSIYSSGTNTAVTVSTNNIQDYFSAAANSAGVYANTAANTWTVTTNRFYQTGSRTVTGAGVIVRAIHIATGGGHTITGNIIGAANSSGTGTSAYTTTTTTNQFVAIEVAGNATASSIQGNQVSNINITTASNLTSATAPGIFCGIYVSSGAANIGTVTGNVIGSAVAAGSINITSSVTATALFYTGIYATSSNTVNIQFNSIGGISLLNGAGAFQYNFNAIYVPASTGSYTIADNTIGSTSAANSVITGSGSTAATNFTGISNAGSGAITIAGNIIQNCTTPGTGASVFTGITNLNGSGAIGITNNSIISCRNDGTGALTAISNAAVATTLNLTGNILRNNSITSATGSFAGIVNSGAATTAININANQFGNASGGLVTFTVANSSNLVVVNNSAGAAGAALSVQSNDFRGIVHSVQGTGNHTYILNSAATLSQNISTNTFTNLTANITSPGGSVTFISNSVSLGATGSKLVKDNAIVTAFTKTGAGSNLYFYFDAGTSVAGATVTNEGNIFSAVTVNGLTPVQGWFNTDGSGTAPTKNIYNNTFSNITSSSGTAINALQVTNGTGSIYSNTITGVSSQNAVTAITVTAGSFNIYSNTINTLSSSVNASSPVTAIKITGGTTHNVYYHVIHTLTATAASSTVTGISVTGGTTVRVYKNKLYNLNSISATDGINIGGGTTVTVDNNLIGTLNSTSATDDALRGIGITGGTTINVYYNTVNLTGAGGSGNFGSSALFAITGATLDLRNNILINTSANFGTGKTVVYRRSNTTLTSYAATSNNNLYYVTTPGASRLIYYDGTNSDQTLGAYQTRVAARDAASVSAALTFLSTTGSSLQYLHLNGSNAASDAATVVSTTDDYDDEVRSGTTPDIGADEFVSTPCPATPTITGISSAAPYYAGDVITITGTNLSGITYATINDINATIGTTTATTAQLTIPVTMTDSVGVIQVAATSSCTFSNTFNFVFAGYITLGTALTGNWSNAAIWRNSALPVANAPATINNNDNVTLDVSAVPKDPIKFTINAGATFTHANNTNVFGTTFLNNTTVNGTLVIDNSATPVLATAGRFISPKLRINNGGTFTNNSANAAAVTIANFYVYNGGTYNHNAVGSTGAGVVNDFPGSTLRTYGATSSVVITKWANGLAPINLPASGTPGWGNLTINVATLAGSWNQTGLLTNVQGNLNIAATGGGAWEFRFTGTAVNNTAIAGNFNISGGIVSNNSGTGNSTINVGGNLNITGGYYILCNNSGTTGTVNITGNCTLNGGHILGAGASRTYVMTMAALTVTGNSIFGLSTSSSSSLTLTTGSITISGNGTMYSSSSGQTTINCTGDFSSTSTGTASTVVVPVVLPTASTVPLAFCFQRSSNTPALTLNLGGNFAVTGTGSFFGGSGSSPASINFTGGTASVTYNAAPSVMAVTSPSSVKNNFFVTSGKTLTLLTSILPASSSTSNNWNFTVNTGATLVCGTNEIGTNAATARTGFTLQTGATLKTAHAGGVFGTTTGTASITTTVALASLSSGATYEFNGSVAQVTSAFTTTPTAATVANMVINNTHTSGVTLSQSFTATTALQLTTGTLTLSTFNLTAATVTGAPYSNTKMVITNSTGALGQPVSLATIVYPVGNSSNYTPASYTFTANSTARNLFVRAVTPRNANDVSATDYINNRWWNTDLSVTTGTYAYTSVYTYINGDMVGTAANIRLNRWTGSAWVNDAASVVNNTNFTITSGSLNESTGTLSATAQWVGRVYTAPAIYHWTNAAGGSWLTPTNWLPNGVPGSGDGVIFDVTGGATYTTSNMPVGINLTQFTVSTNNNVTYNASAAGTVGVLFPGTATPEFSVASGSSMTIGGTNVVTFSLAAGATGNVAGSLNLRNASHRVTVTTPGVLTFPSGGYFSYGILGGNTYSGNPFGTTGTTPVVTFQNGSICECFEGSNPFGATITDRLVAFNAGSLFRYSDINVATSPSISGRTYANFTWNANKTTSIAAANSFVCDSLTATVGTFNLNLQGTPTPDHAVRGNINVVTGATLTFSPTVSGTINMNSGATQIIWGGGTFSVNSNAIFDINAGTTVSLQKNMDVNNQLSTTQGRININGTLICTGENYVASVPFAGGGLVQLQNTGTLSLQSVNGINTTGTSGNIRTTNFGYTGTGGNFIYSGNANQVTGNRLPVTLGGTSQLSIANTGTAPNDIVTLTTNNTTTPRINLVSGQFNAGTGGTLIINGGTNLVVGTGGNQYLTGTAADNIIRFATNGAVQGTPELWNVTIGTSGTGVDFQNNARINGILLINNGGFVVNNAPRYNTGSFLIYNTGGSYNRNIEWSTNAGLGTPAYPHHVTVQNGTTLDVQNPAFDLGCGGNLNLGSATAGTLVLSSYTQPYDLYVKGNINIGNTAAGTLTMSNSVGCDLYLTGNWTRNAVGTVNFGFGNGRSVYFDGSTDATITATGGQYFPYVRMQKTAKANKVTLADHVSIGFEVTFTRGTLDLGTNNKFFTLLSNVNYDARVDVSDSTNTDFVYGASDNTGQFIVQRYIPARRAWRLLTAPLKASGGTHTISQAWQERGNAAAGLDYTAANWAASVAADTASANFATQITGNSSTATGFDVSPNNSSSIKFFSGGGVWSTPANTNSTSINSREGWFLFVRGDRETYGEITNNYKTPVITTLRPRGQIFIGQKTITASGMQTVGNPYASAVDYFTMTRGGAGWPANPTYYVWDPSLGGSTGAGAWVALTWNGTNFTRSAPFAGTGTSTYDDRFIASGAAIMVDFPAGGGTLSMNEVNKNTDSTTTAFRPIRQLTTVLQAKDVDNTMYTADAALNLFGNNFNNDFDIDDARKLTNVNENICVKRNGGYLAVERKQLHGEADTIFYYTSKLQRKNYQLKFIMDDVQVPASTAAFLEDTYLKTKTPVSINGTTEAGFAVTDVAGSAAPERFRLVFRRSTKYNAIVADMLNSDVAVNWLVSDELNIEKYEIERSVNGNNFVSIAARLSNGNSDVPVSYNGLDISPAPGEYYYRIKSISKNGVVTYSDAVKIKVVKASPALYVFPNPVTNNAIQLQLNKAAAGTYTTVLYATNGQVINNEIVSHTGGTATKTIQPKQRLVNGTYQLMVTAPDGQVSVIKVAVTDK